MIKIKRLNEQTGQWEFDQCSESTWQEMQSWIENGSCSYMLAEEDDGKVPEIIQQALDSVIEPEQPIETSSTSYEFEVDKDAEIKDISIVDSNADPNDPNETLDLEAMTVKELKALATERGIKFAKNASKSKMIELCS